MSKIACAMATLGVVAGIGAAAMPLASYAVESSPVAIKAIVNDTIQISTSTKEVVISTIKPGAEKIYEGSVDVTVETTDNQYTLNIKDSDNTTALVSENGDQIAAGAPSNDGETTGWGWKGGSQSSYKAITTAEVPVVSAATIDKTATTTVTFGISAGEEVENGTYVGGVVFTATSSNV